MSNCCRYKNAQLEIPARPGIGPGILALIICLALGSANTLPGEIYKTLDKNGQVIYSDQAEANAEVVKMPKINTAPPVKMPQRPSTSTRQTTNADPKYASLRILKPAKDATIHHGGGLVSVSLQIKPRLIKGHKIQYLVDGKVYKTGISSSVGLENINRGNHSLGVRIVDKTGKVLKSSAAITIHVIRPSAYKH